MRLSQNSDDEIAVEAIRRGRAFADAFRSTSLPCNGCNARCIEAFIERLEARNAIDPDDESVIEMLTTELRCALDRLADGYADLVFSGPSGEYHLDCPVGEHLRVTTELFKQYVDARNAMLDCIAAAALLRRNFLGTSAATS